MMRKQQYHKRLALGLSSYIAYVAAFFALYTPLGATVAAFSALPVSLLGWLLGLRAGLIGALLTVVLNGLLLTLLTGAMGMPAFYRSIPGTLLVMLLGPLAGWLGELVERVKEQSLALQRERDNLTQQIAERRRAEQALRESEARLRLLFEQIPAALWTTDRDLRFTSALGTGLTGDQQHTMIGVSLYDFFGTDDVDFPPIAAHRQALAGTAVAYELEWESEVYQAHVEPFLDADGTIVGCIGIALNITPRKRMEREREQLIVNLQEAIANIKTLSGLLPICASCKKIRDDRGYWNQIEIYIRERSNATFTHGLCPECTRHHYPDLYRSMAPDEASQQIDRLFLLPLELNQRADRIGSALSTWIRLRQASIEALISYLGCDGETLERLANTQRPQRGLYHDADIEIIAASLGIDPQPLKRLLIEVEQAEDN